MRGVRAGLLWAASAAIGCNGSDRGVMRDPGAAPADMAFAFPVDDLARKAPPDLAEEPDDGGDVLFGEPCGEVMGSILVPGLQYSGSVSFVRPKAGNQNQKERVSISAPILPNVLTLYQGEGGKYPPDDAGRKKLAHDSALVYCFLLKACAPAYPKIKLQTPLTPDEIATNYDQVAECSYFKYTAKPYWIPQLVLDVDLCGTEIGPGWRLITEADANAFTNAELMFIQQALTSQNQFGGFYFSLRVFARGKNGSIMQADLTPGAAMRVLPFPMGTDLTLHYEGGLALRCMRVADI